MASPQKENGYAEIANELLDAYAKYFPGHGEGQVLIAIIRKTYGWHKKEDKISVSQIEDLTGLSRRRVIVCIQNLEAKRMIEIQRKRGRGNINLPNTIKLQKNHELWVVTEKSSYYRKDLQARKNRYKKSKQGVVTEIKGSDGNDKRVVTENEKNSQFPSPTKDTYTKDSIQKILSQLLCDEILLRRPNYKKPNLQQWAKHVDLMIRIDKRDPAEIERVIRWCQRDDFWQDNILSTAKLRKQYDQLALKMSKENPQQHDNYPQYEDWTGRQEQEFTPEEIERNKEFVRGLADKIGHKGEIE